MGTGSPSMASSFEAAQGECLGLSSLNLDLGDDLRVERMHLHSGGCAVTQRKLLQLWPPGLQVLRDSVELLGAFGREADEDTPDFTGTDYVVGCLAAFQHRFWLSDCIAQGLYEIAVWSMFLAMSTPFFDSESESQEVLIDIAHDLSQFALGTRTRDCFYFVQKRVSVFFLEWSV